MPSRPAVTNLQLVIPHLQVQFERAPPCPKISKSASVSFPRTCSRGFLAFRKRSSDLVFFAPKWPAPPPCVESCIYNDQDITTKTLNDAFSKGTWKNDLCERERERERERRKRLDGDAKKVSKLLPILILTVLVLSVASFGIRIPPVYAQTTYYVNDSTGDNSRTPAEAQDPSTPWKTIQHAVDNVPPGSTIQVAAGTYDEQVVIGKSLTLQGAGDTTTIVKPSSAAKLTQVFDGLFWYGTPNTKQIAGIIVANVPDGSSVTVKNVKVDESSVTTKPAGSDYLTGIFYRETGGTVDTVSVVGGGSWSSGDRAYGMYLSAATNTVSVEVKGCTITNYDKNGIEANGNTLIVNVHHSTITGRGPTLVGDEVQNGVVVGRDAVATVNYNTISNLEYGPKTWWAAGILFYHYVSPTGKSATANGNTITNCQIGIMFKNANALAQDNTVSGGTVGLAGIHAQPNYAGTYTASFVGNTVSGITDYSAIDAETFATLTPGTGATLTATIRNNTLTGGYGTADGVYVGGNAGSVTATISDNIISGWPEHGINLGDAPVAGANITGNTIQNNVGAGSGVHVGAAVNAANVHVNFNNIVGNTGSGAYGVSNLGSGILDAEKNWWGSATGPTHTSNPGGTGDAVTDNVDFTPWLGGESTTATVTNGVVDATATADSTVGVTGTATVTVAKYAENPGGAPAFSALGSYVDVHVDDASGATEITIQVYYTAADVVGHVESALKLYWWDGAAWVVCSDSGVTYPAGEPTYRGYIWAKIRSDTTPNLNQLTGTPFGGGGPSQGMLRLWQEGTAVQTTISLDGTVRDDWGLNWVKLSQGNYVLSFSNVPGWKNPTQVRVLVYAYGSLTPESDTMVNYLVDPIPVYAGKVTEVRVSFTQLGYLRVITSPAVAGTIYVNGVPVNDWGCWVPLTPGTYTVSFGDVPGYTKPADQVVAVTAGTTFIVTGTYTPT